MTTSKKTRKALLLVDIQNDFLPGGALPAPDGDRVVPVANRLMPYFSLVVASQDWHPEDHGSFASQHEGKEPGDHVELGGLDQILWPDHCIQGTEGAEFHPDLNTEGIDKFFHKAVDPEIDSYSAFYDNGHKRSTGLGEWLKEQEIEHLYVVGIATDYCVLFSAKDARQLGFEVTVVEDGVAGIEMEEGDVEDALEQMAQMGVEIVPADKVIARLAGEPKAAVASAGVA